MGIWGPGLYDNDCTLDVKDTFQNLVGEGKSPDRAKQLLTEMYAEMFADSQDGPIAKVALADQLWTVDALDEETRQETLKYLDAGGDIASWQDSPCDLRSAREAALSALAEKFRCPSKKRKKRNKPAKASKQSNWQIGQVYAIPVNGEYAYLATSHTEYILLYITSEGDPLNNYPAPKVWAKLTKNGRLPKTQEDFNELEYVQIACTAMADRFKPFRCEDDLPSDFKQPYVPDAWGFLPEYSFSVFESKGNHPPASMLFLGIFDRVTPPPSDYIRYHSGLGASWKYLEDYVMQGYRLHNLRTAKFYQSP